MFLIRLPAERSFIIVDVKNGRRKKICDTKSPFAYLDLLDNVQELAIDSAFQVAVAGDVGFDHAF